MSRTTPKVGISCHEARVILDLAGKYIAKKVSLSNDEQVRHLSINNGAYKDLLTTGTGFYLRLDRNKPMSDRQVRELANQVKWIQRRHKKLVDHPHPTIPLQVRVMDFTEPANWDCMSADPVIEAIRVLYENEGTVHKPTVRGYKKYVRQIIWDGLYAIEAIDGEPLSKKYAATALADNESDIADIPEAKSADRLPLTSSLHTINDLKRDMYAITEGLAHLHQHGFSHGDFAPNNILQTGEKQNYIIDPDDTKPLDYRGRRLWDNFSRFSPPEVLFKGHNDAPGLLSDINGSLKAYPEAIDTYQLAMTVYFMVTGHANLFKLPEDVWQSQFWQDALCKRLARSTTIQSLDNWGYLDFSHPLFHNADGANPDGPLLKAWILQGLTIDPDERLKYSPEKLLGHEFFKRDAEALEKIKRFTSVNRDIAAIVGNADSPLEDQLVVQQLAGSNGRLTRAAAVLYREARRYGYSNVLARSCAYPGYGRAVKSLSTTHKVVAVTAIVLGIAAIVAANVITLGIPIVVAACVVGSVMIVGGVGVPLNKVRKQTEQADKSLRTAHRGMYVKFIDHQLPKQQHSKSQKEVPPHKQRQRGNRWRQRIARCRLLGLGRPNPVPGIFAVGRDSSDSDSEKQPLLKKVPITARPCS
ncbi:MAG: phosphotransferase [Coxiellaceae bacterium]|nr:phosphotransferase [Coxiellaceae bacterium]